MHAHRGKADARPSPSRATARCVRPAPWARAWARVRRARAVRRARPSPTAANRNRVTQALARRRTAHQPACPREARTGREIALPLAACLSACFFECSSAWATAAHAMARRARAVLAAPSPPASPRNPARAPRPARSRRVATRCARRVESAAQAAPRTWIRNQTAWPAESATASCRARSGFRCPHARRRPARPRSTTLRACRAHSRHPSPGR